MGRILVIDDDHDHLRVIMDVLKEAGHEVTTASDGRSGIKAMTTDPCDIVLTDLMMPQMDGMKVLDHIVKTSPETKCIILTGFGTIRSSVDAIKSGAFDYVTKPISSSELLLTVNKALQMKTLEEENFRLKKELREKYHYKNIIGTSDAVKKIFELIEKVADTDGTVLISGPAEPAKN